MFSCITIKHTFSAFLLASGIVLGIFLLVKAKLNVFLIIPTNVFVLTPLPLFVNLGFLLKENKETFPIVSKIAKNPCMLFLPENQVSPDWLEMYPVHE